LFGAAMSMRNLSRSRANGSYLHGLLVTRVNIFSRSCAGGELGLQKNSDFLKDLVGIRLVDIKESNTGRLVGEPMIKLTLTGMERGGGGQLVQRAVGAGFARDPGLAGGERSFQNQGEMRNRD